jgi:hypothetical protein
MATIAEIIAAKKAAAATLKPPAPVVAQPLAEDQELTEAINRIDPLGRHRAGLVVSAKTPLPPAIIAEKLAYAEMRSLSRQQGEAIPMTPNDADNETATWHEALNSFETSLCVMRDPKEPEVIWLAVQAERNGLPPILIHRLPWCLFDHPATLSSDGQPF